MYDCHSHLLPGLDDGSPDWETSLAMARAAAAGGTTHLWLTPHFRPGIWENPRPEVLERTELFRRRLEEAGIPLSVHPANECWLDPALPERLQRKEVCTVNDGGRYLLVELPFHELPPYAEPVLFALQLQGVTPIIAHPERNARLRRDPGRLGEWVDRGMLLQANVGSFQGRYGAEVQRAARRILQKGWYHLTGSDAHDLERRPAGLDPARAAGLTAERAEALRRGLTAWGAAVTEALPLPDQAPARYSPAAGGLEAEGEAGRGGIPYAGHVPVNEKKTGLVQAYLRRLRERRA